MTSNKFFKIFLICAWIIIAIFIVDGIAFAALVNNYGYSAVLIGTGMAIGLAIETYSFIKKNKDQNVNSDNQNNVNNVVNSDDSNNKQD